MLADYYYCSFIAIVDGRTHLAIQLRAIVLISVLLQSNSPVNCCTATRSKVRMQPSVWYGGLMLYAIEKGNEMNQQLREPPIDYGR